MRWASPFDYVDALDFDAPNPSESVGSAARWTEMRKRRERDRIDHGLKERELAGQHRMKCA